MKFKARVKSITYLCRSLRNADHTEAAIVHFTPLDPISAVGQECFFVMEDDGKFSAEALCDLKYGAEKDMLDFIVKNVREKMIVTVDSGNSNGANAAGNKNEKAEKSQSDSTSPNKNAKTGTSCAMIKQVEILYE